MTTTKAMQKTLPKGWKWVKLGEVCNLVNGRAFKPSDWSETGKPIIRIQNLNYPTKPFNYFNGEIEPRYHIKNGDVLLSWSGTPGTSFGAHIWHGEGAVLNQHIFRVELPEDRLLKTIFVHAVNLKLYELIRNAHGGVGLSHITKGRLERIEIPLPPLPTQHKIVEILEEADNLRKLRRQADEKMRDLIPSLFVQMFGDPVKNPRGWEVKHLGDVCHSIKDGPHVSPIYQEQGIPFISVQNIQPGMWILDKLKYISSKDHEEYCKKCKPEKGNVLYSKGGSTGMAKFVDLDYEFSIWVHLALLKINRTLIDGRFLEAMLNSPYCYKQSQSLTGGIANRDLVLKNMKKVLIFLPPLPLQQEFAKLVEDIEAEKARQAESRMKLDELFSSLMQRAFTGELVA